jgi:hypothetical protein
MQLQIVDIQAVFEIFYLPLTNISTGIGGKVFILTNY